MALDLTQSSTVKPLLLAAEAKGEARGREEGEARGREEGEAHGRIMGMLELRFGPDPRITPELARDLLDRPDPAKLIANCSSLDELLT